MISDNFQVQFDLSFIEGLFVNGTCLFQLLCLALVNVLLPLNVLSVDTSTFSMDLWSDGHLWTCENKLLLKLI